MRRASLAFLMVVIVFISGCMEDQAYYRGSKYKQLDIAKLVDIPSGGYNVAGSVRMKHDPSTFLVLHFCENNRYVYYVSLNAPTEEERPQWGNYQVDLAHNTIKLTSDKTDSQGKHFHGTIDTGNGYFEQKKGFEIKGYDIKFYEVDKINSSDCNHLKDDYYYTGN